MRGWLKRALVAVAAIVALFAWVALWGWLTEGLDSPGRDLLSLAIVAAGVIVIGLFGKRWW